MGFELEIGFLGGSQIIDKEEDETLDSAWDTFSSRPGGAETHYFSIWKDIYAQLPSFRALRQECLLVMGQ